MQELGLRRFRWTGGDWLLFVGDRGIPWDYDWDQSAHLSGQQIQFFRNAADNFLTWRGYLFL